MIHDMAIHESWMNIHELAMMVNLGIFNILDNPPPYNATGKLCSILSMAMTSLFLIPAGPWLTIEATFILTSRNNQYSFHKFPCILVPIFQPTGMLNFSVHTYGESGKIDYFSFFFGMENDHLHSLLILPIVFITQLD